MKSYFLGLTWNHIFKDNHENIFLRINMKTYFFRIKNRKVLNRRNYTVEAEAKEGVGYRTLENSPLLGVPSFVN